MQANSIHHSDLCRPSRARRLALPAAVCLALLGLAAGCGSGSKTAASTTSTQAATTAPAGPATTAPATTTKAKGPVPPILSFVRALLKAPADASLPHPLQGSKTTAAALSPGSRRYHAQEAIETTNGGALVGYLVFKTHADALADLRAFPPNTGPNKIVARDIPGLPKPSFALAARGNGFSVRYVVFVDGSVVVDTWAYGKQGTSSEAQLLSIVKQDARWAHGHIATAATATHWHPAA